MAIVNPVPADSEWVELDLPDGLNIRVKRSAIQGLDDPGNVVPLDTPFTLGISGSGLPFEFMSGGLGYVSRSVEAPKIVELVDRENFHRVSLTEAQAVEVGKFLLQHLEFYQARKETEDQIGATIHVIKRDCAQEKGWDLVKELVGPINFDALQRGESIVVKGSDGADWKVWPNGKVEQGLVVTTNLFKRLKDSKPLTVKGRISGYVYSGHDWVFPDKLAAVINLIQNNANTLVKKWGCGNLEIVGGDLT